MSTPSDEDDERLAEERAKELEDGSLAPDGLDDEPAWRDEGSDDET